MARRVGAGGRGAVAGSAGVRIRGGSCLSGPPRVQEGSDRVAWRRKQSIRWGSRSGAVKDVQGLHIHSLHRPNPSTIELLLPPGMGGHHATVLVSPTPPV